MKVMFTTRLEFVLKQLVISKSDNSFQGFINVDDILIALLPRLVGLLPTGHKPTIGTLLLPVKSLGLLRTLFFLHCVPGLMVFLAI